LRRLIPAANEIVAVLRALLILLLLLRECTICVCDGLAEALNVATIARSLIVDTYRRFPVASLCCLIPAANEVVAILRLLLGLLVLALHFVRSTRGCRNGITWGPRGGRHGIGRNPCGLDIRTIDAQCHCADRLARRAGLGFLILNGTRVLSRWVSTSQLDL